MAIDTFHQVLKPLRIFSWITGIGVIECPADHPRITITVILLIIRVTVYTVLCYMDSITFYTRDPDFNYEEFDENAEQEQDARNKKDYIRIIIQYHGIVNAIYSTGVFLFAAKDVRNCVSRISLFDETLGRLGYRTNYSAEHKTIICIVLLWGFGLLLSIAITLTLMTIAVQSFLYALVLLIVEEMPFNINSTVMLNFIILVGCIGRRFEKLNNIFQDQKMSILSNEQNLDEFEYQESNTLPDNDIFTNSADRLPNSNNNQRLLKYTRQLHLELIKIARKVNDTYGIQIVMLMSESFMVVVGNLYDFYASDPNPDDYPEHRLFFIIYIFRWTAFFAARVLHLSYTCNNAVKEGKKIGDIIHKFDIPGDDQMISTEIKEFTLQLKQNPFTVSAYDIFDVDFGFLGEFLGTSAIYLVILIQMGE